jgi:SanA protein
MSGDNRFQNYNEPGAMQAYAIELGIPEEDIVVDYAGQRTYDTCYRAREIFQIDEVILVTQSFHLPRAIYTCNSLGIKAMGVPANNRQYRRGSTIFWNLREIPATFVALWQINFSHPLPILGGTEPISRKEMDFGSS